MTTRISQDALTQLAGFAVNQAPVDSPTHVREWLEQWVATYCPAPLALPFNWTITDGEERKTHNCVRAYGMIADILKELDDSGRRRVMKALIVTLSLENL